jgi:hypothetical protein
MNGYAGQSNNVSIASSPGIQPPPPDGIATHLGELGHAVEALDQEVGMLAQRMEPVIRPGALTVSKEAGVPTPIRSAVANSVVSQVEAVSRLIRRVRDLRESIDL